MSAEQLFVMLDYPYSTTRNSVNGAFMPALALAIDTDDGGATDQLMAESRSD